MTGTDAPTIVRVSAAATVVEVGDGKVALDIGDSYGLVVPASKEQQQALGRRLYGRVRVSVVIEDES